MTDLTDEMQAAALLWYSKHKEHVDRLLKSKEAETAYPPSGSDAYRPELWRPPHWRWLMDTTRPKREVSP